MFLGKSLRLFVVLSLCLAASVVRPAGIAQENKSIILATTTSTQDSGLLDVLIPVFEKESGFIVKTISVGSGQALKMGEKGEADVLLVHSPDAEKKIVEQGFAVNRRLVMHNDFIIIGPSNDPAKIKGLKSAKDAFKKIAETNSLFFFPRRQFRDACA
jgi:tungstate transport system substrate-binding protein